MTKNKMEDIDIDITVASDDDFKPSLFEVQKYLTENIVGEKESSMSLFTNWLLAEQNIQMAGPRSSGKTYITDNVMSLVGNLEEDEGGLGYVLTASSEKAARYMQDELNKARYAVVLELNKLPKEVIEILKDWGEGKDSTYKTTEMKFGRRAVKKTVLKRKPFVFCLADEDEMKADVQLASRLTTIRTDNSITQNKAVMKYQAMLSRLPDNPLKIDEGLKQQLRQHIVTLPSLKHVEFKNPAAEIFVECVPPFFTDCRRDFPKYLRNITGIARFYWKDRIKGEVDGKEVIFITPEDMYSNHVIYGPTLISSALKCNNIEREMMTILRANPESWLKRADMQKEITKKGMTISAGMVSRHLNTMTDLGYTEREKEGQAWKYKIGKMFQEFNFTIDWMKVIEDAKNTMREYYPDYAEEYIARYCDNTIVRDPYSDEMIDLSKINPEKVNSFIGQSNLNLEEQEEQDSSVMDGVDEEMIL